MADNLLGTGRVLVIARSNWDYIADKPSVHLTILLNHDFDGCVIGAVKMLVPLKLLAKLGNILFRSKVLYFSDLNIRPNHPTSLTRRFTTLVYRLAKKQTLIRHRSTAKFDPLRSG